MSDVSTKFLRSLLLGGLLLFAGLYAPVYSEGLKSPQDDPTIDRKLFEFSLAFELQRKCAPAKARKVRAFFFYGGTYSRAERLGFSKELMDAHINDKENQKRMQVRVDGYLTENGVDLTKEADYCDFARKQIEQKTASGRLLRIKGGN